MKVSVITVNLNNSAGLERTLLSVTGQTFTDYELLVIDGGSTDGSRNVIEKYSDKISHSVSEKDNGVYNAMNKGIMNANGDYCIFINSGDEFYQNDVLTKVFQSPRNEDFIYGDLEFIEDGKAYVRKQPETISFTHLFKETLFHPATFIKRKLFNEYGLYNEKLKIVADYEFFFKVLVFNDVSLKHLPVIISRHYMDGMSSKQENQQTISDERRSIHLQFLPATVVDELSQVLSITSGRPYRFAEKIRRLKHRFIQGA